MSDRPKALPINLFRGIPSAVTHLGPGDGEPIAPFDTFPYEPVDQLTSDDVPVALTPGDKVPHEPVDRLTSSDLTPWGKRSDTGSVPDVPFDRLTTADLCPVGKTGAGTPEPGDYLPPWEKPWTQDYIKPSPFPLTAERSVSRSLDGKGGAGNDTSKRSR